MKNPPRQRCGLLSEFFGHLFLFADGLSLSVSFFSVHSVPVLGLSYWLHATRNIIVTHGRIHTEILNRFINYHTPNRLRMFASRRVFLIPASVSLSRCLRSRLLTHRKLTSLFVGSQCAVSVLKWRAWQLYCSPRRHFQRTMRPPARVCYSNNDDVIIRLSMRASTAEERPALAIHVYICWTAEPLRCREQYARPPDEWNRSLPTGLYIYTPWYTPAAICPTGALVRGAEIYLQWSTASRECGDLGPDGWSRK